MSNRVGVREMVLREEPTGSQDRESNQAPFVELALQEGTSAMMGRKILEFAVLFIENCGRFEGGKTYLHDFADFSQVMIEDLGHGERVVLRNNRGRWAPEKVLQFQMHAALIAQQYGIPIVRFGPGIGKAESKIVPYVLKSVS